MSLEFHNSYAELPDRFYARLAPTPVRGPELIKVNRRLAREIGFPLDDDPDTLAGIFAGNILPEGSDPIAQAYAGHQFGGWSPQLGDGRAILLGEVLDDNGTRRDVQLKGSGRTPFSRGGDGRAWLGPVLREYVLSEAMAALGVPTTRALAAVTTGEDVLREEGPLPGAVFTRVASSHIRVGTFQFFAARDDQDALRSLVDYTVKRHYPDVANSKNRALGLLEAVIDAQARLIAKWMGLGFIHGVMNTDNMTVSGETIDYGPCAFMDPYRADTVFSSIDRQGRYSYENQPRLAHWNLAQLASALLPLIDSDTDKAIEIATAAVDQFVFKYQDQWTKVFAAKVGTSDTTVIQNLLLAMEADQADFTNTFRALGALTNAGEIKEAPNVNAWLLEWRKIQSATPDDLNRANPAVIPRNHQVQRVIDAGVSGDFGPFEDVLKVLEAPYSEPSDPDFTRPPKPEEVVHRTFCGT